MGHHHDHAHGHAHEATNRRRLALAFAITLGILLAELVGAWLTDSLALIVDAGHMLTDASGLLMALTAANLALRPPTLRHTWGLRRAEVLAAGTQATILAGVGLYGVIEGCRRLFDPVSVSASGLLWFGVIGLLGNVLAIAVLAGGDKESINVRAALLEVVNDALGSVAVIVSALAMTWFGWSRADSLASIFIAILILPRAWMIVRESGAILLEATPVGLDLAEVRRHVLENEHVLDVHDLHASQITTGLPILTAHVVLREECFHHGHAPQVLDALQQCLAEHFPVSVKHSTFQFEPPGHQDHEDSCSITPH
ncbi:cation diffusion facilitator family transporter [Corynebacterium epidermidicanis]|uniref:Cation diffusion facilitator family transporter n=1 Tax=Corynebacterium epidermidicanis TaxID=1050174 RepID=A0A0G3GQT2_9CORY|nr:cation diffusion facilitator family transporter [Corynebacterium epidermidicanis]AKK01918.1 cation diffusion facilitator family transporter [Corynebacterium epidermidicanis]